MQKVFDYAGNEIKEGNTIVQIKVVDRQPKFGYIVPATGKTFWSEDMPDKDCWEVCGSAEVIRLPKSSMDELGFCVQNVNATIYESLIGYYTFRSNFTILAIKGISDTKEYYEAWKKKQSLVPAATK